MTRLTGAIQVLCHMAQTIGLGQVRRLKLLIHLREVGEGQQGTVLVAAEVVDAYGETLIETCGEK